MNSLHAKFVIAAAREFVPIRPDLVDAGRCRMRLLEALCLFDGHITEAQLTPAARELLRTAALDHPLTREHYVRGQVLRPKAV